MMEFCSNCVVETFKAKFRDWGNVEIIPLFRGILHFHMLWRDRTTGEYHHFTHKGVSGSFTSLWFKGRIENLGKDGMERLLKQSMKPIKG